MIIMLIDDNEADRFLTQVILETVDPSIEMLFAVDGVDALEKLKVQDTQPDLILLDINMPRMNGHEFLKEYSQDNTLDVPQIPAVVMLTSSNQEQDKVKAGAYNCVRDYMLKPVSEQSLRAFLDQVGDI